MTVPVFEEYEPALDCPCAGCAQLRRERGRGAGTREGGPGARRTLALAAAVGLAWGCGGAAASAQTPGDAVAPGTAAMAAGSAVSGRSAATAADQDPMTPQGGSGPLHGKTGKDSGSTAVPKTTRAEIISRAKRWVSAQVPYSMTAYWSDGYRQDCSGYVSMAWNLPNNEWTGSLAGFGVKIDRADLQPGDILLFHNPADPNKGSHVTIFGGWTDASHTTYLAYEQTPPHTRAQATPMAYWSNSDKYVPYRYKGLTEGAAKFGPGANDAYVTRLGEMLVARGGKRFYSEGPGPRWGESDRRATQAFQRAQGWRGAEADGLPGPATWRLLTLGLGKDIPAVGGSAAHTAHPAAAQAPAGKVPAYPGSRFFGPGRSNAYVERLGRQLVKKGYGTYYTTGPGRTWSEADRRNVAAYQRALGWRGSAADGYPGPETWRRLFA
ncbi:peptidoglycan-binding protein [Streptomyces sp. DW26H14]|uniref:peptidoglycan-binding protein n=1 Tax=Streptomyces sp. DW26H14 TaxID=3435395 RepID=UPI00403DE134